MTKARLGRLERGPSLTEQAYTQLRRRIITCELAPGSEVSELDLAEDLAMSKTPVREALARLALEGYVDTFPRRGYRVRSITFKDINDLFDVRVLLEPAVAALAAARLTSPDVDELDRLSRLAYTPDTEPSLDGLIAANREFHSAIAHASGNPRLTALVISYMEESERFLYVSARNRQVNYETSQDHAALVDAFRRKDPPAAQRIMANHIEHTRNGLIGHMLKSELVEVKI